MAFVPEVKYSFTEIFRPCLLPTSFQTVDISSKKFIMSTKMTRHEDIVTMVSICRGTPSVLHEQWVGCSGLEVGRKYGRVKESSRIYEANLNFVSCVQGSFQQA